MTNAFSGRELDWLARDRDGNIGFFSSAGFGTLPDLVIERVDLFLPCFENVQLLPLRGAARLAEPIADGIIADWCVVAERGLFAYDWQHRRGRYELIASPTNPLRVAAIDDQWLATAAGLVTLNIVFGTTVVVTNLNEVISS